MQKLLTTLAAAAMAGLFATAGQACEWDRDVTASIPLVPEVVAMSTYDGAAPLQTGGQENTSEPAVATDCPDGATDCQPASE